MGSAGAPIVIVIIVIIVRADGNLKNQAVRPAGAPIVIIIVVRPQRDSNGCIGGDNRHPNVGLAVEGFRGLGPDA